MNEASLLLARTATDVEDMKQAARGLADRYHCVVLIKDGHLSGITICDVLYGESGFSPFGRQKIESRSLHDTGCMLSSAIATLVTCSNGPEDAIHQVKAYIGKAILRDRDLHIGYGNEPLCHPFSEEE